jgi:TolB-like protein
MNFFAELKRRNVFKVAVAYSAVAWMFLELSALTFNAFSAPAWVMKVVIFIAIAGFAVAVLLAWAFELTPQGIKRTTDLNETTVPPAARSGKWATITIPALALALMLVVLDAYVFEEMEATNTAELAQEVPAPLAEASTTPAVAAISDKSLAVMPFDDLSPDDQSWLAEGISADIATLLNRVNDQDLLVISPSSSFQLRDQEQDLAAIREALKVKYLLTGSLRRIDSELRLDVRLISTDTGAQLWAQSYDRTISNVLDVQIEIAERITAALQVTLATGTFGRIPGMTRSPEAYEELLRGVQSIRDGESVPNIRRALQHLERALVIDPDYALASLLIYDLYIGLVPFVAAPSEFPEREMRAQEALAHARSVGQDSPVLLLLEARLDQANGDLLQAEQKLLQAVEHYVVTIGPATDNFATLALLHMQLGRPGDAIGLWERARAANPLDSSIPGWMSEAYTQIGDYDRALNLIDEARQMSGQENNVRLLGNRLLLALYTNDSALLGNYTLPLPEEVTNDPVQLNRAMLDRLQEPSAALAEIRRQLEAPDLSAQQIGVLSAWAAYFGDQQLALQLVRARATIAGGLSNLLMFRPIYSEMRKLPEFKELAREIGLVDYWRTTGNWGEFCRPLPETENDFECF